VNNWDLVDGSCREILGEHLKTRSRRVLANLARDCVTEFSEEALRSFTTHGAAVCD
jgi:hypothetical protein